MLVTSTAYAAQQTPIILPAYLFRPHRLVDDSAPFVALIYHSLFHRYIYQPYVL